MSQNAAMEALKFRDLDNTRVCQIDRNLLSIQAHKAHFAWVAIQAHKALWLGKNPITQGLLCLDPTSQGSLCWIQPHKANCAWVATKKAA